MLIISALKQAMRSGSQALNFVAIIELFGLLNCYARLKNPNAAIIYKILVFFLIEKHDNATFREFMLQNFKQLFEDFQSIPVAILLEPLIKQLQIRQNVSYFINTYDVEFFQRYSFKSVLR